MRRWGLILLILGVLLALGCGNKTDGAKAPDAGTKAGATDATNAAGGTDTATGGQPTSTEGGPKIASTTPLRVFAADSLNASLPTLASRYRATHEGRELSVTFGKSTDLAQRITENKQADLLIADNPEVLRQLKEAGLVTHATVILGAQIVIITNAEKPVLLSVLDDLRKADVKQIAVPQSDLATGKVIYGALQQNAILNVLQPKLKEYDSINAVVKAVGKNEVSVGIAFAHSVRGKRDVKTTMALNADDPLEYIAAAIAGSDNAEDAEAFIKTLQDQESQAALEQAAFSKITPRPLF